MGVGRKVWAGLWLHGVLDTPLPCQFNHIDVFTVPRVSPRDTLIMLLKHSNKPLFIHCGAVVASRACHLSDQVGEMRKIGWAQNRHQQIPTDEMEGMFHLPIYSFPFLCPLQQSKFRHRYRGWHRVIVGKEEIERATWEINIRLLFL